MYKVLKWPALIAVILITVLGVVTIFSSGESETNVLKVQANLSNDTLRYTSSQFTQPTIESEPVNVNISLSGFELIAENDVLELYVEEKSLALKIVDKRSGYVWNSGLDENIEYNLNDTWKSMAQSAITIDYLDKKSKVKTESILTNETVPTLSKIEGGFQASVDFEKIGISIQLEVRLVEDTLEVHIPQHEIIEEENKLITLRAYPFLGAVHQDELEGYMFIPDGSGALIRFESGSMGAKASYQASVYGNDKGFKRSLIETEDRVKPLQEVTMPIYGIVHGTKQNGLFTIIEEGQSFSELIAYPAGVSTDFNWITSQYHYRYSYYQPTSQSMSGYNTYQEEINEFDITEKITFLTENDADYIGMANKYQAYLVEKNILSKGMDKVDIRLEFLGAEVKKGLLWDSVHAMTKVREIPEYVNRLKEQNIDNLFIVYRGWTEDGLTGTLPNKFPVEKRLGNTSDFKEVNAVLAEQDTPIYYFTDYTKAYDGARGFSGRSDVARKINAETIGEVNNYFLSPYKSLEIAKSDLAGYEKYGIANLAITTTANQLFSDFNKATLPRSKAIELYAETLEVLQSNVGPLALYQPNDYMWMLTDRYLDIPMRSSNYSFVTDTVPFLQMVLKGYIPYYAGFSNFQSNVEEDTLRMIEYGAYPSFYLTSEPSHLLSNTPSQDLYTSEFNDWESTIVEQYSLVEQSLGQVEGETIVDRFIHDIGIVEVTYSNGISILVNYTNEPVEIEGQVVERKGFKVVEWGSKR